MAINAGASVSLSSVVTLSHHSSIRLNIVSRAFSADFFANEGNLPRFSSGKAWSNATKGALVAAEGNEEEKKALDEAVY
jgi:hypothetical protein